MFIVIKIDDGLWLHETKFHSKSGIKHICETLFCLSENSQHRDDLLHYNWPSKNQPIKNHFPFACPATLILLFFLSPRWKSCGGAKNLGKLSALRTLPDTSKLTKTFTLQSCQTSHHDHQKLYQTSPSSPWSSTTLPDTSSCPSTTFFWQTREDRSF